MFVSAAPHYTQCQERECPKKKKRAAQAEAVTIGIIGGSGLYSMPGLTDAREVRVKTPFGDPSDAFVRWHPRRAPRRLPGPPRPRPSLLSQRNQLSRQHLRHEDARRHADHFRQRGRLASRRSPAARLSHSQPVLRSHAPSHLDVFRRRHCRSRRIRQAHLRRISPSISRPPATARM